MVTKQTGVKSRLKAQDERFFSVLVFFFILLFRFRPTGFSFSTLLKSGWSRGFFRLLPCAFNLPMEICIFYLSQLKRQLIALPVLVRAVFACHLGPCA